MIITNDDITRIDMLRKEIDDMQSILEYSDSFVEISCQAPQVKVLINNGDMRNKVFSMLEDELKHRKRELYGFLIEKAEELKEENE
jgi:uncharacterized coiled-coil DUF342 family protein